MEEKVKSEINKSFIPVNVKKSKKPQLLKDEEKPKSESGIVTAQELVNDPKVKPNGSQD